MPAVRTLTRGPTRGCVRIAAAARRNYSQFELGATLENLDAQDAIECILVDGQGQGEGEGQAVRQGPRTRSQGQLEEAANQ